MTDIRPTNDELETVASLLTPSKAFIQKSSALSQKSYPINEQLSQYTPDQLLGLLDYHGITMLAEHFGTLPASLKSTITQRKAMMAANDSLKQQELIRLFDAFAKTNLTQCILFKGSALAYTLYSKPWLRPRSDSDILINQNDRDKFDRVFETLGYQKAFAVEGNYVSYQSTYSKALAGKSAINIDLHWRINNRQILAKSFNAEELCKHGQTLTPLSSNIITPSHVHSLLISSLHRLGHHQSEERLAWLYDIHLLANSLDAQEWQSLTDTAQAKQLSSITLDALKHCQRLLETNVPKSILEQLTENSKTPEPSQLFLKRDLPERTIFWNDLKSMQSFSAKLGFLLETLIPSPSFVRQQMNTDYASWGYLKRFIRGVKRVF